MVGKDTRVKRSVRKWRHWVVKDRRIRAQEDLCPGPAQVNERRSWRSWREGAAEAVRVKRVAKCRVATAWQQWQAEGIRRERVQRFDRASRQWQHTGGQGIALRQWREEARCSQRQGSE